MIEKDKDRFIGECECIYSDDKDNILVALDIAEAKYENIIKEIDRIPGAYQKSGLNPDTAIQIHKNIIKKFRDTRRKVGNTKICEEEIYEKIRQF